MLRLDAHGEEIIPGCNDKCTPETEISLEKGYMRAFASVVTRCFGWSLPCTMVVPFADFINHHNVDSSYEMVSSKFKPVP